MKNHGRKSIGIYPLIIGSIWPITVI